MFKDLFVVLLIIHTYCAIILKDFLKKVKHMKKILTIQDFSCVGKCSLTVAMPIISAFGIETCALPTALLSTHTQFKNWTFANLCEHINPITDAWEKENIMFDGICTG